MWKLGSKLKRLKQRGDTVVEVTLSFAALGFVIVVIFTIMNTGLNSVQRSLEITQVRQQIDSQAEGLRFIHKAYTSVYDRNAAAPPPADEVAGQWVKFRTTYNANGGGTQLPFNQANPTCPKTYDSKAFYIDTFSDEASMIKPAANIKSMSVATPDVPPFAQVYRQTPNSPSTSYGLWVNAYYTPRDVAANKPGYIDFRINACWQDVRNKTPDTIGTIVRLYEPL